MLNNDSYAELSCALSREYRGTGDPAEDRSLVVGLAGEVLDSGEIDPSERFDVAHLGARLFSREAKPLYSVAISGFNVKRGLDAVERYAAELTTMCTDLVRSR